MNKRYTLEAAEKLRNSELPIRGGTRKLRVLFRNVRVFRL